MLRAISILPYFEVVKPTIVRGFNYKAIAWADVRPVADAVTGLAPAQDDRLSPVA
jgi:hypothetical protein